jgi:hypothetical protein
MPQTARPPENSRPAHPAHAKKRPTAQGTGATFGEVRETLSANCWRRGSSNTTEHCGAVFGW